MPLNFAKIFFILLFCSFLVNYICKYGELKTSLSKYIREIKYLINSLSLNSETKYNSLENNFDRVSREGLNLLKKLLVFTFPYILSMLFIFLSDIQIIYPYKIILSSVPYFSLIRRKK